MLRAAPILALCISSAFWSFAKAAGSLDDDDPAPYICPEDDGKRYMT